MIPQRTQSLAAAPAIQSNKNKVAFVDVEKRDNFKALIYGTGGIGKSILAALACKLHPKKKVAFLDKDNSLPVLHKELKSMRIDIPVTVPCGNWQTMRNSLQSSGWDSIGTIVVDTINVAEEMCIQHCLANVKTFEKPPTVVKSLEDYGWGKDVRVVYENFLPLLSDLEQHYMEGRNIILIANDCKPEEVNPMGTNYIRYEPRLRSSKRGENSIRLKVKEWVDYMGFICLDTAALDENKKGVNVTKKSAGSGSRTMYLTEQPAFMAKNRGCEGPLPLKKGESPWDNFIG